MNSIKTSLNIKIASLFPFYTLCKKESICTLLSPFCPLLLVVTIFASSLSLLANNYWLSAGLSTLKNYFSSIPLILIFTLPMLTMNVWADERKQNTSMLLLSLPISSRTIVYAKYTARLLVWLLMLLLLMLPPLSLIFLLQIEVASFFLSYFVAFLLGASLLALSQVFSFVSIHPAINFLLSFLSIIVLNITQVFSPLFHKANLFWRILENIFSYISFSTHFENASKGIFDSRDIVFYLVVLLFALEVNVFIVKE